MSVKKYIYKKKSTNRRQKKIVTTVATVPPRTVANIRNFKKKKDKVPHQISTVG